MYCARLSTLTLQAHSTAHTQTHTKKVSRAICDAPRAPARTLSHSLALSQCGSREKGEGAGAAEDGRPDVPADWVEEALSVDEKELENIRGVRERVRTEGLGR